MSSHALNFSYRPDIEGMRAIAVVIVTLFHLEFNSVSGGYIGVDVFFVISGFLITSIIWNKKKSGTFKLSDFYFSRIRRLMPPLYVTVAITFLASMWILTPEDFQRFARSAVGALFSISNFVFYFEAGYWDSSSELKPLLHTWSLGVEEQFYLFWPLLVILAGATLSRLRFGLLLLAISVFGFAFCHWLSSADISAAFYLFPARIFQFSAGALVAFAAHTSFWTRVSQSRIIRDLLFLGGLLVIIACCFGYNDETPFPGIYVLAPTVATQALLLAGTSRGQSLIGELVLSNPISIWLGRVSYAMYLTHWPIISLYRYKTGLELTLSEQLILSGAILVATIVLHYGVERVFYEKRTENSEKHRMDRPKSSARFASLMGAIGICASLIAAHATVNSGWEWRFQNLMLSTNDITQGKRDRFQWTDIGCRIEDFDGYTTCGNPFSSNILIIGNSHEPDAYNFFQAGFGLANAKIQFVQFGATNLCDNLRKSDQGWRSDNAQCQRRLDTLFDPSFLKQVSAVVYAANQPFAENKEIFQSLFEDIKQLRPQLPIVVFGGYINTTKNCASLYNESGTTEACKLASHVSYFENDASQFPLFSQISEVTDYYIDRVDLHCIAGELSTCETQTPSGVPFILDEHHLTFEFAAYSGRKFAERSPTFIQSLVQDVPVSRDFELKGPMLNFTTTPAASAIKLPRGTLIQPRLQISKEHTGGRTGVAHIKFDDEFERQFSGRKIRITTHGTADEATDVWFQYSTAEVGNSGWIERSLLQGEFEVEFEYTVPPLREGGGDYFGIYPKDAKIIVTRLNIEIID